MFFRSYLCRRDRDRNKRSCRAWGGGIGPAGPESAFDDYQEGEVVLGKDLSNIYSVEAMRSAYNQKYPNGDGQYGPSGIRTTHYYVRFLPKNEDEYDEIVRYGLSEIPLYSEVVKGGSSYHDPSIPADQYTWQYALIPVDEFELTRVRWEKLQDMFIINQGQPGVAGPGGSPSYTFWEALEILNHKNETGEDIGPNISWTPSDKIQVYDDLLKRYIPLEGVPVTISADGYKTQTVYTDATGAFKSAQTYPTSVYYKIEWKGRTLSFEVKDGDKDQAYLVSNRSYKPFNVLLNDNNLKQKNFATIYRAGCRAYFKDYLDMSRPFVKGFGKIFKRPIRIAYYDELGTVAPGFYDGNVMNLSITKPHISIWLHHWSDDLFKLTTHELAHAGMHIKFWNYNWSESNKIIHESWADAVAYYITKLEYADYDLDIDTYDECTVDWEKPVTYALANMLFTKPNSWNRQTWPHGGYSDALVDLEYSSLMIDLIDDDNQALYFKLKPMPGVSYKTFPNDDVSGFDLYEIQNVLNVNGLTDFKNQIKTLNAKFHYNDPVQIDTLFRRYQYYWNK